jgi:anti-anti-sigma factor
MKGAESNSELPDSTDKLIDCDGAWLRPSVQGGATIVQIGGEIDACNGDQLSENVFRYAATASALVVDATAVDFCSLKGLRDLLELDQLCHDSGIQWALIAGGPLRRLLEATGVKSTLPVADSVSAALQSLTIATYASGG